MKEKVFEYVKYHKETTFKIAILTVMVLIAAFFIFTESDEKEIIIETTPRVETVNVSTGDAIQTEAFIWVDVSGQVAQPGVLKLKPETRVYEAIEGCGGVLENADTSLINMAAKLHDEDKLYIPKVGEPQRTSVSQQSDHQVAGGPGGNGLININTASSEQLQQLSGVGPSTAEKIINYRTTTGLFDATEDIKNVSGIGEKTFAKFKEKICI